MGYVKMKFREKNKIEIFLMVKVFKFGKNGGSSVKN